MNLIDDKLTDIKYQYRRHQSQSKGDELRRHAGNHTRPIKILNTVHHFGWCEGGKAVGVDNFVGQRVDLRLDRVGGGLDFVGGNGYCCCDSILQGR